MSLPDFNSSHLADIYLEMDMLISRQCDLQDILSRSSISDDIGIFLQEPLTIEDAKQLTTALASLVIRVDVSRLSLTLDCRCSQEVANVVARGLSVVQGLKNIALVFDNEPGLSSIFARAVGFPLIHGQQTPKTPLLTMLPREIRYNIIEYALNTWEAQEISIDEYTYDEEHECCMECMPLSAIDDGYCACRQRVGGYSSNCLCDCTRTALLWANKLLHADSTFILFSTNRVITMDLLPTFKFFSSLSDTALHAMKMVDIKIYSFEYRLYSEGIPEEFTKIVNIIKEKCNLAKLWLSIDCSGDDVEIGHCPEDELHLIDKMRENLITALKPLKDLNRFDVYLSGATPEDEDRMEKAVMGDDYDAIARGKLNMFERYNHRVHERVERDENRDTNEDEFESHWGSDGVYVSHLYYD